MLPVFLYPGVVEDFPDPRAADVEGLVAVGGDLCAARLLRAYESGIFPWFDEESPGLWWCPDPRAVLLPENLHVSRRMARVLRGHSYEITWDRDFPAVIAACAERREDGTWIVPEMIAAYTALHDLGHAHSLEVWDGDRLVGGLYGVQRGGLFAGESMFHRVRDASKIALITAVKDLSALGVEIVDVQMQTDHLASMGVTEMRRTDYLRRLADLSSKHCAPPERVTP